MAQDVSNDTLNNHIKMYHWKTTATTPV